jgi:hypothetical protein
LFFDYPHGYQPKKGDAMDNYQPSPKNGLECLLKHLRISFRIPENLNHYTEEDFRAAEKKYIKYCINYGLGSMSTRTDNRYWAH